MKQKAGVLKGRVIQPLLKLLHVQYKPAVKARQLFSPERLFMSYHKCIVQAI